MYDTWQRWSHLIKSTKRKLPGIKGRLLHFVVINWTAASLGFFICGMGWFSCPPETEWRSSEIILVKCLLVPYNPWVNVKLPFLVVEIMWGMTILSKKSNIYVASESLRISIYPLNCRWKQNTIIFLKKLYQFHSKNFGNCQRSWPYCQKNNNLINTQEIVLRKKLSFNVDVTFSLSRVTESHPETI